MKYLFLVLLLPCICIAQKKKRNKNPKNLYWYTMELASPQGDTSLTFSDSAISLKFSFDEKMINFTAKNKTAKTIKLIWDETVFMIADNPEKVMHKGIQYMDKGKPMPPSVIPVGAVLSDVIVPISRVHYKDGTYTSYGGWDIYPILMHSDNGDPQNIELIKSVVGSEIKIYMPFKDQDGKDYPYNFTFRIRSVNCITCKTDK